MRAIRSPGAPCSEGSNTNTDITFSVKLPAGLASWTRIELTSSEYAVKYQECDSGGTSDLTWTASWEGQVDAEWPANNSGQYASYSRWDDASGENFWSWSTTLLEIEYQYNDGYATAQSLTINGDPIDLQVEE